MADAMVCQHCRHALGQQQSLTVLFVLMPKATEFVPMHDLADIVQGGAQFDGLRIASNTEAAEQRDQFVGGLADQLQVQQQLRCRAQALRAYLLGFATQIEILAPATLRRWFKTETAALAARYATPAKRSRPRITTNERDAQTGDA